MNALAVQTEQLQRKFGQQLALDGLSLSIPRGRVVALLGSNGAGKTTLMRLLTGLIQPTEGRATVLDDDARHLSEAVTSRLAAMLDGQEPPRWATLRQLLALQAAASRTFDHHVAARLLEAKQLSPSHRYGSLSKGQKGWALGTLVLASGADLLLLDEPADGLDPASRRTLYDHLRDQVNDRNATALIATHIIADIERIADEVAILDHGKLRLHADLEDLREQVRLVEIPEDAPDIAGPDDTLQTLAERREDGLRILLLRSRIDVEQTVRTWWGDCVQIRPVDLETLFLMLTDQPVPTKETQPCA